MRARSNRKAPQILLPAAVPRMIEATSPMKEVIAIAIAFAIGAACARFAVPVPAPPHWIGVALIAAIWLGYTVFKPAT